jgi:hypothetical protein
MMRCISTIKIPYTPTNTSFAYPSAWLARMTRKLYNSWPAPGKVNATAWAYSPIELKKVSLEYPLYPIIYCFRILFL